MIIQSDYGLTPVVQYKSKHGETVMPLPDQLLGIELEIEGFSPLHNREFGGFTFTTDGSLRANEHGDGIEAVSKPIAAKNLGPLLTAFFKKYGITDENYSERCSTHIHFNVQDFEWEQLSVLLLVYQTVERLLFSFIGQERDMNIFCVPWSQCNLTFSIVNSLRKSVDSGDRVIRGWQKYTALNLAPVQTQGTVEFRHLHGTCDVQLILQWVSLISQMFRYAKSINSDDAEKQIIMMNSVSNYEGWLEDIFREHTPLLYSGHLARDLSRGVIDTKLMLQGHAITIPRPRLTNPRINVTLDNILQEFDTRRQTAVIEDNLTSQAAINWNNTTTVRTI